MIFCCFPSFPALSLIHNNALWGKMSSSPPDLRDLLRADETAYEMLRRGGHAPTSESPTLDLDPEMDEFLKRKRTKFVPFVCEIEGESGKTGMAMRFAVRMLEKDPKALVVVFDLDYKMNSKRFVNEFRKEGVENETVWDRVKIVRVSESVDMMVAIHAMCAKEMDAPRLVVIDSLLAFYEMNILTDPLGAGYFVEVPALLFRMAVKQNFAIVATKPAVGFELVSKTWTEGVTHRLRVNRRPGEREGYPGKDILRLQVVFVTKQPNFGSSANAQVWNPNPNNSQQVSPRRGAESGEVSSRDFEFIVE